MAEPQWEIPLYVWLTILAISRSWSCFQSCTPQVRPRSAIFHTYKSETKSMPVFFLGSSPSFSWGVSQVPLDHYESQHDSWALSSLHLSCVWVVPVHTRETRTQEETQTLKQEMSARVYVNPWRSSCPATCPQQEQTILRIVLLLRLLSFGIPSLLVQKKRLFCKIQGEDQVVHTISVNHYKFSPFLVYRVCDLFLAALVLDINIFLCNLIS